jgi:hypothetical protein
MIVEMSIAGFLFLFILVLNIVMAVLGHINAVEDYDLDDKLPKISKDPNKFKISITLALIEHVSIIALAIMLFISFSKYNILLGIVWTSFRIGEGLIQIYNESKYWELLNIARQYSDASDADKKSLSDSGYIIVQSIGSRFSFAMILWSIGTLTLAILFVTHGLGEVVPPMFGWLGIITSITVGVYYSIKIAKPSYEGLLALGGLLAIIFEVIIGVWLLFFAS